ncbi:hypothetical protein MJO29_008153, partial [Puccinia striiformis f. sp. tritici]
TIIDYGELICGWRLAKGSRQFSIFLKGYNDPQHIGVYIPSDRSSRAEVSPGQQLVKEVIGAWMDVVVRTAEKETRRQLYDCLALGDPSNSRSLGEKSDWALTEVKASSSRVIRHASRHHQQFSRRAEVHVERVEICENPANKLAQLKLGTHPSPSCVDILCG